jgi:hypothetical protein
MRAMDFGDIIFEKSSVMNQKHILIWMSQAKAAQLATE